MIMPYLNFSGNCEEAFRFYQQAFHVQEPVLARYGDAPADPKNPLSDEQKNQIMHGQIMLTETGGISGADAIWPVEAGSTVHIHVILDSVANAEQVFYALSEGAANIIPLAKNPPPHDDGISGMITDKFGFPWVISALL